MPEAPPTARLFHSLALAYSTAQLYGSSHRLSSEAARHVCKLVQIAGPVTLEVTPEAVFVQGQRVDTSPHHLSKLTHLLKEKEVAIAPASILNRV